MDEIDQIYRLNLHEVCIPTAYPALMILKVPGGWIYYTSHVDEVQNQLPVTAVFVMDPRT